MLLESREEETNNNILLSKDSEESVNERSTFLGVFVANWVLFGIIVFYFLFFTRREAALEEAVFCVLLFLLKIGCSLNLENLNSYKGKQALGVEEVLFFGKFGKLGALLKSTRVRDILLTREEAAAFDLSMFVCLFVCCI